MWGIPCFPGASTGGARELLVSLHSVSTRRMDALPPPLRATVNDLAQLFPNPEAMRKVNETRYYDNNFLRGALSQMLLERATRALAARITTHHAWSNSTQVILSYDEILDPACTKEELVLFNTFYYVRNGTTTVDEVRKELVTPEILRAHLELVLHRQSPEYEIDLTLVCKKTPTVHELVHYRCRHGCPTRYRIYW